MQTIKLTKNDFGDYYADDKGNDILCCHYIKKLFFWFRAPKAITVSFSKDKFAGARRLFVHKYRHGLEWSKRGSEMHSLVLFHNTRPYLKMEFGDIFKDDGKEFPPQPVWVKVQKA